MPRLTDSRVASIKAPPSGQQEHADDLVTGLRLRVGAGGRKAWIVRTRANGKPINRTLGAYPTISLAHAREAAKSLLLTIATEGAPAAEHTFGELASEWIEKVAEPNNRSWKLQKRRLEIHVLPKWKDRKLASIRRGDVRDLVEAIEGEVAPNRALTLIRTLFRYAMSRDWIEASPAEAIAKPRAESPRDRVLDMAEAARIYTAADLLGYPFGGFVKLLFLTAQRRTEVAAMRWDDIDLDAGTWTLTSAGTKSARAHLVPLSSAAVAILRATPRLGDYIWTDNGSTHIQGFAKAKTRLDALLAGGSGAVGAWVFHDIRRSTATHMVRLGVPELVVGRVLNHAVTGVTGKVYALYGYTAEKRSALERWAADLQRQIEGRPAGKVVAING